MPKKNQKQKQTSPSPRNKKKPAQKTPPKQDTMLDRYLTKTKRLFARREPDVQRSKGGARMLQTPVRYWYNPLTWRHRRPVPNYKRLSKARILFWTILKQMWHNKKLYGGIIVIYGILDMILVRGLSGSNNLSALKTALDGIFHGIGGKLVGSGLSFTYLLATSGSGNTNTSGVYQGILLIACSLAFIWALRQVIAKNRVRIRDSFYLGMYPIVPFMLVFVLICVQLLPLALGGGAYSTVLNNNIVVNFWEKALAFLIFLILALWSLRMVTASIFALYIVTLPDMTPMRAYRSARDLVYGRRLYIWRKLIFLPVVMFLLSAIIELPLIYFITPLAQWAFFVLSMFALPVAHGYLYNLYRELL